MSTQKHLTWFPTYGFNKQIQIGRLKIGAEFRPKSKNEWGRFGGGCNWKLGVQIGCTTVIVSLLVFEMTFTWKPKSKKG
jgi:hypothetical protein